MYYTSDHEWIDFQGTVAYMGVSSFKLLGFRAIHEVLFNDPVSYKKRGDIIAWIRYQDYKIDILMPVDGSIVQVNRILLNNDLKQISDHLGKSGWMFSIIPSNRYDRKNLIPVKDYLSLIKNEFRHS
jgi:glycine cleavage system H protein